MSIKAVLFDLDGTLLPMDQQVFIKAYLSKLAQNLEPLGYEPKKLADVILQGTTCMVKNDGKRSNEQVFWDKFEDVYGENTRKEEAKFARFYEEHFDEVQSSCGFCEKSKFVVEQIKKMGLRTILATNPLFPAIATQKRIAWAGLSPEDFEYYTTYENSRYCKPNLEYYKEVLQKIGAEGNDCLMVGNDVAEDMIAQKLGMKVFLLTDCLINKDNQDVSEFPHGNMDELLKYVKTLLQ